MDPSLRDMTEAALRVLSRNPKGFYLFVEGESASSLGKRGQQTEEQAQAHWFLQGAESTGATIWAQLIWR